MISLMRVKASDALDALSPLGLLQDVDVAINIKGNTLTIAQVDKAHIAMAQVIADLTELEDVSTDDMTINVPLKPLTDALKVFGDEDVLITMTGVRVVMRSDNQMRAVRTLAEASTANIIDLGETSEAVLDKDMIRRIISASGASDRTELSFNGELLTVSALAYGEETSAQAFVKTTYQDTRKATISSDALKLMLTSAPRDAPIVLQVSEKGLIGAHIVTDAMESQSIVAPMRVNE